MTFFIHYSVMFMNIKTNSKLVKNNDIFVAIRGEKDGHNYINEAINNGASTIICENGEYSVPTLKVLDSYKYLKKYIYNTYYDLIKDIILIGITGTNGKTTTSFLIYETLRYLNVNCAYIGTLGFYIEDKIEDLDNTTPDIVKIYELLLKCVKNNVTVVVMEVSSHALSQDRVYGLKFKYGIFTNLTQDHLDYHKDMDSYFECKKKLFNYTDTIIVNIDDKYASKIVYDYTYGFNGDDYKINNYKLYIDKVKYNFYHNNRKYKVKINIPGKYNIYNSIACISVLNDMGYDIKKIIKILNKIKMPDGRMEIIKYKKRYIIVDYAHTPDAIYNVLSSALEFKKNRILTIVGCGGNRDKDKRSKMGDIATNLSDYVIFTNDNPRFENEKDIMNDITSKLNVSNYEIEYDRLNAIKKGINMLNRNDILFVLGKGHENHQIIKDIKYHFNDIEEINKLIK